MLEDEKNRAGKTWVYLTLFSVKTLDLAKEKLSELPIYLLRTLQWIICLL